MIRIEQNSTMPCTAMLNVPVPREWIERLDALAKRNNISRAKVARTAIEYLLDETEVNDNDN